MKFIKSLAKRNPIISKTYNRLQSLRTIPARDWLSFEKLWLFYGVSSYTMVPYSRLSNLHTLASDLIRKNIEGSFVECGVCNGGSAGIIAGVAKSDENRSVWLFDSWEGLPEPGGNDVSHKGSRLNKGSLHGSERKVRELLFGKFGLDVNRVHLDKGWFFETLPSNKNRIGKIALLHLDCDWYDSMKFCLEELYGNVVEGGFVVIDDYGYWKGCKQAVDEFVGRKDVQAELINVDWTGVYFQKT